jgi:hypothetical protein
MSEMFLSVAYDNYDSDDDDDVFEAKIRALLEDVENLLARVGALDAYYHNNDAIQSCLIWMRSVPGRAFVTLHEFSAYTQHLSDRFMIESILRPLYTIVNKQFDPKAPVVLQDIQILIEDLRERPWSRQSINTITQKTW